MKRPQPTNHSSPAPESEQAPEPLIQNALVSMPQGIEETRNAPFEIVNEAEFWELWLPYELQIARRVDGVQIRWEGQNARKQENTRRFLLGRLWQEAQDDDALAKSALDALKVVIDRFTGEVQEVVLRGEFESRPGARTPGDVALDHLFRDPTFEKSATRYALLFGQWLVNFVAREGEVLSPSESQEPLSEEAPIAQKKKGRQIMPDAMVQGTVATASNFDGDRDLTRGLALKNREGHWAPNANEGTLVFKGRVCDVTYQPPEVFPEFWYETREEALKQLDLRFRRMRSELTADVIDILFHHWYHNRKATHLNKAGITLSQICQYRGVQPQKKNLEAHWQAMRDARSLRLMGGGIDVALLEMASVQVPQLSLWGDDASVQADTAYIYSPGFFIAQAIQDNPIFIAPYAQKLWSLDAQNDAAAKKLARYLRGEWRLNTQKYVRPDSMDASRFRTWRSILEDSGFDVEGAFEGKDPRRLFEEVEQAMERLFEIGAIRDFGQSIYHPEDRAQFKNLPRKGMLAAWLALRVSIDPDDVTRQALAEANRKRIARSALLLGEAGNPEPKRRSSRKTKPKP